MSRIARSVANVNFRLLRTFLVVAQHRSFRTAAEFVHRSPSAVSTQIKQLEEQLGVTLFHRTTRNVQLTNEGAQLVEHARRAVNELEDGVEKMEEVANLRRGRVSFSCSPTIASTKLPEILADFEQDFPEIEVYVRELTSGPLLATVRQKEVDFGIGPVADTDQFQFEVLASDQIYALVPKKFLSDNKKTITLAELVDIPLLLLNQDTEIRKGFDKIVQDKTLTITTRFQFAQAQTLIVMAQAGLGAAILPQISIPGRISASMQARRIVEPSFERKIAIITNKGQSLSPAASEMVAKLRRKLV